MTPGAVTSRIATAVWNRRHPEWAAGRPGHVQPQLRLRPRTLPRTVADAVAVRLRARGATAPPWITADALELLDEVLRPGDRGVEWGSGGTTTWFAERITHLTSVEGTRSWHAVLEERLRTQGVGNVDLHLVPFDELGYETPEHEAAYVGAAPDLAAGSLDLAFVDGEYRDACMLRAIDLLRSGGVLVLDNAETYLPTTTRSPWHVDRPATPRWGEVAERLQDWRRVWTTNGVWDTALWFKP
ncbi:MAG: hypothetical protein PGN07_09760 [Aeromicrobium erythreum]